MNYNKSDKIIINRSNMTLVDFDQKKFIETNLDYALIFEDDAVFLNNFTEKLQKFIIRNFKYIRVSNI